MKRNYRWVLNMAILVAAVLTIAITVLGVLSIPIIMSLMYSWYWMFLYVGYLLVILYVALYFIRYDTYREGGTHK